MLPTRAYQKSTYESYASPFRSTHLTPLQDCYPAPQPIPIHPTLHLSYDPIHSHIHHLAIRDIFHRFICRENAESIDHPSRERQVGERSVESLLCRGEGGGYLVCEYGEEGLKGACEEGGKGQGCCGRHGSLWLQWEKKSDRQEVVTLALPCERKESLSLSVIGGIKRTPQCLSESYIPSSPDR